MANQHQVCILGVIRLIAESMAMELVFATAVELTMIHFGVLWELVLGLQYYSHFFSCVILTAIAGDVVFGLFYSSFLIPLIAVVVIKYRNSKRKQLIAKWESEHPIER